MRIEILAPCGALDAPPTRVIWSATEPIELLQLDRWGERPRPWLRRHFPTPVAHGTIALTIDERSAIETHHDRAITARALSAAGESLAQSLPVQLCIEPPKVPR